MVCMARLGIAAVMLLLISSAGVQAAPPQVLKAGDYTATANWITYKGQVRIDIGLFYVHSGWKKFFLHSAGIGAPPDAASKATFSFMKAQPSTVPIPPGLKCGRRGKAPLASTSILPDTRQRRRAVIR